MTTKEIQYYVYDLSVTMNEFKKFCKEKLLLLDGHVWSNGVKFSLKELIKTYCNYHQYDINNFNFLFKKGT